MAKRASEHDEHRKRTKRRFLSVGLSGFEPHNVLELLLFYSIPRRDVNSVAHRLIDEFGSFDRVLEADYDSLLKVEGVGESSALLLKLIMESCRYYELQKNKPSFVGNSTSAVREYARSLYVGENREICYLLCFDASLKMINCVKVSEGSFNAADVSIKRVVRIASINQAAAAIIVHNHPAGLPAASSEDIALTKKLFEALAIIGVELNDHIIVTPRSAISMADAGIINDFQNGNRGL